MHVIRKLLLILAAVSLLPACSSIYVNTDYALEQDFSQYRQYRWHPDGIRKSASLDMMGGDIYDNRVRRIIDNSLQQRGMVAADQADFYVNYDVVTEDRVSISSYNTYGGYGPGWGYYPYGYGGWGMGSTQTSVYYYTQGMLIVDIIDASSGKLVWRATAESTLDRQSTPEKKEQTMRNTIEKMFEAFPPIIDQ